MQRLTDARIVSWAGPYPALCKKRPTANLVSRKVLVPLLGQMAIAIAIQAITYAAVKRQVWYVLQISTYGLTTHATVLTLGEHRYIPPKIQEMKQNISNSENTVLFLISCFEYIFSGVVLNAGRPFRQPVIQNCMAFKDVSELGM